MTDTQGRFRNRPGRRLRAALLMLAFAAMGVWAASCGRKEETHPRSVIDTLDITNISPDPREQMRLQRYRADRLLPDSTEGYPLVRRKPIYTWDALVKQVGNEMAERLGLHKAIGLAIALYDPGDFISAQVVQFNTPRDAFDFFMLRYDTETASEEYGDQSLKEENRLIFRRQEFIVTLSTLGRDTAAVAQMYELARVIDERAVRETLYPPKD